MNWNSYLNYGFAVPVSIAQLAGRDNALLYVGVGVRTPNTSLIYFKK